MTQTKVGTRPNRYKESDILDELSAYIAGTYNEHYAASSADATNVQVLDLFDSDENEAFCKINAVKYLKRFGKKAGRNRRDLIKAAHYILMMIHFADTQTAKEAPQTIGVTKPATPQDFSGYINVQEAFKDVNPFAGLSGVLTAASRPSWRAAVPHNDASISDPIFGGRTDRT